MDGWNTFSFPFLDPLFSGTMLVFRLRVVPRRVSGVLRLNEARKSAFSAQRQSLQSEVLSTQRSLAANECSLKWMENAWTKTKAFTIFVGGGLLLDLGGES